MLKNKLFGKLYIPALMTALCFSLTVFLTACGGELTVKDDDDYSLPYSDTDTQTQTENTPETVQTSSVTETTVPETGHESEPSTETEESSSVSESLVLSATVENKITMTAETLIGIPFAEGGSSPSDGFDNSGFIYYVLKQNGYVNCPRGLYEQSDMGIKISDMNDLKSGDLVFFSENQEHAQFGGIYRGDGIMISCQSPGQTVKEVDISTSYYVSNFYTGVRVL